jgi:hypothetical protein
MVREYKDNLLTLISRIEIANVNTHSKILTSGKLFLIPSNGA